MSTYLEAWSREQPPRTGWRYRVYWTTALVGLVGMLFGPHRLNNYFTALTWIGLGIGVPWWLPIRVRTRARRAHCPRCGTVIPLSKDGRLPGHYVTLSNVGETTTVQVLCHGWGEPL